MIYFQITLMLDKQKFTFLSESLFSFQVHSNATELKDLSNAKNTVKIFITILKFYFIFYTSNLNQKPKAFKSNEPTQQPPFTDTFITGNSQCLFYIKRFLFSFYAYS